MSFLMPLKQGSLFSRSQHVSHTKSDSHGTFGFSDNSYRKRDRERERERETERER